MNLRDNLLTERLTYTTEIRAAGESGSREFDGVLVPYDTIIDLGWGGREAFDPGSIELHDQGLLILWQHLRAHPIGVATATRDTPTGYEITGRLSTTPQAVDAYTLLLDGVVTRLSIGFEPLEYRVDEDGVIHWTRVIAREASLVTFPAYDAAQITAVRTQQPTEELHMPTETEDRTLTDLAGEVSDLSRAIDQLRSHPAAPAVAIDRRSAGEVLRALVAGDEATVTAYEAMLRAGGIGTREYDGGVVADSVAQNAWVGDLTRIFDASSGVLADVFSTGSLPATGMSLEFGELDANTTRFEAQAKEGDPIAMGNVKITSRTTPVRTYAGGSTLSRQEIERAPIGLLNTTLEAMATAAGARKKAVLRAAYNALVAERRAAAGGVVSLGATLAASEVGHWEDSLIDAAIYFARINLALENLVVSGAVFKHLRSLTVSGERVFTTDTGNRSGALSLPGLTGRLASLPVRMDPDQAGDSAVYTTARAIRQYDSALISLTDEAILSLTKSFASYRYGAVAPEVPAAILPVELAA